MHSADWKLDSDELKSLFNSKTKAIIFNNPNNPLGKVFTRAEVEEIADLCKKFNVLMISDDVYEHMARFQICDFVLNFYFLPYLTFILRHYFCCKHCGLLIRISYFCFVILYLQVCHNEHQTNCVWEEFSVWSETITSSNYNLLRDSH